MEEEGQKLRVRFVGRNGRRRYDPASKERLVTACLEPGVSVSRLALDHGVNANLLRKWINAETQIKLFVAALPKSAGKTDDVRSRNLSWLLHLVGDVHQPLHSTAYFSNALTKKWTDEDKPDLGNRGGNEITVVPADGKTTKPHFSWDGMFGGYSTVNRAIADNKTDNIPKPSDALVKIAVDRGEPQAALQFAYAGPETLPGEQPIMLTREYETDARKIAEAQIALGGFRLAAILNEAFKW